MHQPSSYFNLFPSKNDEIPKEERKKESLGTCGKQTLNEVRYLLALILPVARFHTRSPYPVTQKIQFDNS